MATSFTGPNQPESPPQAGWQNVELGHLTNESHRPDTSVLPSNLQPDLPPYEDLGIPYTEYSDSEEIGRSRIPYTLRVPDEIIDTVPKVLGLGFLGLSQHTEGLADFLARNGNIVATYDRASSQKSLAELHPAHLFKPARALSQAITATIRGTDRYAEDLGIDTSQVDLIPYSRDSLPAVLAAERMPDRIRTIIFNNPSGLHKHSVLDFIPTGINNKGRLYEFGKEEILPLVSEGKISAIKTAVFGIARYTGRAPFKVGSEMISAAGSNVQDRVQNLPAHIKKGIVGSRGDRILPILETAEQFAHKVDSFRILPPEFQGHMVHQRHPEAVGLTIMAMLSEIHGPPAERVRSKTESFVQAA